MRREYGSAEEGRQWRAYKSPHETGLAVDFGSHGLYPSRSGQGPFGLSNEQQKQTPFYKWLKANAHKYGITPYKLEAWHWEARIPYKDWV
jgi:LAS superfamily LD-carboxypeptidase LdcB